METALASTSDVPRGKMIGVQKGDKSVLIANVGGTYYAIGNTCTHMHCKISEGTLSGEQAQCPCHGSIFNVMTGAVIRGPAGAPEPSYTVKVSLDQIMVDI